MAFRYWDAIGYVDEVMDAVAALAAYRTHRDESRLAGELTEVLLSAANQATDGQAGTVVDEAKVRAAVETLVQTLEDALHL